MNICIWGNSITYGAWDTELGGWVERLRLFLEKRTNYHSIVYNLGVSGDTSKDVMKRFDIEAEARSSIDGAIGMIMLSIGVNDALFDKAKGAHWVSVEDFRRNIEKLTKKAKKYTNKIIFIGNSRFDDSKTQPVPWAKDLYYTNGDLAKYERVLRETCEKSGIYYISPPELLSEDFADGLHPNARGHEKIFRRVRDYLTEQKLI